MKVVDGQPHAHGDNELRKPHDLGEQVRLLCGEVRRLKDCYDGYRRVRNRVLDTIVAGNMTAHGGDVMADANLYKLNIRRDTDTFSNLYGISPTRALELGKRETTVP